MIFCDNISPKYRPIDLFSFISIVIPSSTHNLRILLRLKKSFHIKNKIGRSTITQYFCFFLQYIPMATNSIGQHNVMSPVGTIKRTPKFQTYFTFTYHLQQYLLLSINLVHPNLLVAVFSNTEKRSAIQIQENRHLVTMAE